MCARLISPTLVSYSRHVILLDLIVLIRALARGVQLGALHRLEIWLHPLGTCRISKTNMLVISEPVKTISSSQSTKKGAHAIGKERDQRTICMY
jgi:hypothetical protein